MKAPKTLIKSDPTECELTGLQIAAHFCVGAETVRRWRRAGMPAAGYNSRMFRYKLSEVEAWLKARSEESVA